MKNLRLILMMIIGMTTIMSFKVYPNSENVELQTGSYGVCLCEDEDFNGPETKLTINDDHTFNYLDNSNPDKKVDIKGTWKLKGRTIILKDNNSGIPFNKKWRIYRTGKCLKSRKGLLFTRICHWALC